MMEHYIAQCGHQVNDADITCPVCKQTIKRIWNVDILGEDKVAKLINAWEKNKKPDEIYYQDILPTNRDEYVYNMCSAWDSENPNADETTREEAFKNIISQIFRAEYERSCKDETYYKKIKLNKIYVKV